MTLAEQYERAQECVEQGQFENATALYAEIERDADNRGLKALVQNDLGCLAQVRGDMEAARRCFERALEWDAACEPARQNLESISSKSMAVGPTQVETPVRVAILSFLFNWPSTGGGIIHTVELATFLRQAGYEVTLIYPQYEEWGLGNVQSCPFSGQPLVFDDSEWTITTIQTRFREAVEDFAADYVIITDSWNIKPYLAEAVQGYPYLLRLQAMECLCPLNNLRLLMDGSSVEQCPNHQLSDPDTCASCLEKRGQFSGGLHQRERALSGVGTPAYTERLFRAFADAEAVLTLNQQTADLIAPHAACTQVVTWGMDPVRFPKTADSSEPRQTPSGKTVILFAGLVQEAIKGFAVLREACRQLWKTRQDFELLVTGETDADEEFLRAVGWKSQEELPDVYRDADIVVVPSIAQEGLSRTAVEAMASGRPVIGSRIGGLAELIEDGVTGIFVTPGDSHDLAAKISQLLDDPKLRCEIGGRGRQRFERDFSWPVVIERDYRPLLVPKRRAPRARNADTAEANAIGNGKLRRLEIGPGQNPLPGFETVDMMGEPTYRARWGFENLSERLGRAAYDEVYSSHALEHIPWNRTQDALTDVFNILQPGGLLEVWVPDFEYIVRCYQQRVCGDDWRRDNPGGDPMLWVNGRIFTYGPEYDNYHLACFDYEHLSICLSRAGFVDIERLEKRTRGTSHGPIDLGIRCVRPAETNE